MFENSSSMVDFDTIHQDENSDFSTEEDVSGLIDVNHFEEDEVQLCLLKRRRK